jgi:hypothetical protein
VPGSGRSTPFYQRAPGSAVTGLGDAGRGGPARPSSAGGDEAKYAISCLGLSKRRMSPTSATKVTAVRKTAPRNAGTPPRPAPSTSRGTSSAHLLGQALEQRLGVLDGLEVLPQREVLGRMLAPARRNRARALVYAARAKIRP